MCHFALVVGFEPGAVFAYLCLVFGSVVGFDRAFVFECLCWMYRLLFVLEAAFEAADFALLQLEEFVRFWEVACCLLHLGFRRAQVLNGCMQLKMKQLQVPPCFELRKNVHSCT